MKHSEILQEAYELIKNPNTWITGSFAKNENGDRVSEFGDSAVCFCSLGAVQRVLQRGTKRSIDDENVLGYLKTSIEHLYTDPIPDKAYYAIFSFNDASTHEEVLAVFRKAIELAKADENGIS